MSVNRIEKLKLRCYKVLPLVYDESLSYYEVVCKARAKLNECIELLNSMGDEFNEWEQIINNLETDLDRMESEIHALQTTTETVTNRLNGVVNDVRLLNIAINDANTRIGTAESNIDELDMAMQNVQSSVTGLSSSIDRLTMDMNQINLLVQSHGNSIASLDTRTSSLEANMGLVQNAVSQKANKINPVFDGSVSANRKANTAVGDNSATFGVDGTATGSNSMCEGNGNTASGFNSHAEGYQTRALGGNAHAEGRNTLAGFANSHAEGEGTSAGVACQHVAGKFNVTKNTGLRVTGNGTSDSAKANAEWLDDSGNLHLAGTVYVGCQTDSSGGTDVRTYTGQTLYRLRVDVHTASDVAGKGVLYFHGILFAYTTAITRTKIFELLDGVPVTGHFSMSHELITRIYGITDQPNTVIEFLDSNTSTWNTQSATIDWSTATVSVNGVLVQ